jgi:hypothetical protein
VFSFREAMLGPSVSDANNEVRNLLEKCKIMARKVKAERPIQWHMNPDFRDYFPSRDIADKLVQNYLRTMESVHRILHIPSFQREYKDYWANPQRASTTSVVKILLVMTIGTCFVQEEGNYALRSMAQQWVYAAQSWISAPFEKGRLNLSGLQVHCLLIIARQTNVVGGDLMWIAAGTLLRTAMAMGFHRDPKNFPKMTVLHGELRRRLWATVLELNIQTSLGGGMAPLITLSDFDTEPPSNFDDEDISETTEVPPTPKPPHVYTQTSIQIQLLKSIRTRNRIGCVINDFNTEPSYDEILHLGAEITSCCNQTTILFNSYPASLPRPSAVQRNLLDMFVRRFVIGVHRPSSVKPHPQFYFSRKTCVDASLLMLSYPCDPPPEFGLMDDYTRLMSVGGGIFKESIFQCAMIICLDLVGQYEEDVKSGIAATAASKMARLPLLQLLQQISDLAAKRIEIGENNVKGYIFICGALGQIKALENGTSPDEGMRNGAIESARRCLELLKRRTITPNTPSDAVENGKSAIPTPEPELTAMDQDYSYDFVMQDGSPDFNFDLPDDAWMFSGLDASEQWGSESMYRADAGSY